MGTPTAGGREDRRSSAHASRQAPPTAAGGRDCEEGAREMLVEAGRPRGALAAALPFESEEAQEPAADGVEAPPPPCFYLPFLVIEG